VTTVKNLSIQRPSALPAACAQVSGVLAAPAATASAHVTFMGVPAARVKLITGASQIQARWVRPEPAKDAVTTLPASYGLVQGSAKVKTAVGDVRGVPPRGRPV
jgi:hypothetical protein